MDERVAGWIRVVMVVGLAGMQLFTGLWAVFSPQSWFDNYPGIGPDLVAAEPPFNAHLATDAGAAFLCTGVALVAGAAFGRRSGVYVALIAYLAFAIPHTWYHAVHDAPGLTHGERTAGTAMLALGIAIAVGLLWAARPGPPSPTVLEGRPSEDHQPV